MSEALKNLYESERMRIRSLSGGISEGEFESPVFGEGPLGPVLMLLGEAPGGEEAKRSRPFVGKAGKQLDELLLKAGIDRSRAFVSNAVKYRPVKIKSGRASNRTPTATEVKAALPVLQREIILVGPRVIVTLGNTPLNAVGACSGMEKTTVGEVHGRPLEIQIGGVRLWLFPLYHPASLIYNRALTEVMEADLTTLASFLQGI